MRRLATRSVFLLLLCGGGMVTSLRADPPRLDPDQLKPASFDKSFQWGDGKGDANSYAKSYSGFGKSFQTSSTDVFNKSAAIGGRDIVPPSVTMNKSFAARSFALPGAFSGFDKSTSLPLKSSQFEGDTAPGFNKMIDPPTYLGPEANRIKQDMEVINATLANTKDLPDRNLTVDEVRALLNHNRQPDGQSQRIDGLKVKEPNSSGTKTGK